jgi:D-alanyl-D-alanine carboxypeptidase
VLQLAQAGELDLDQSIDAWFPGLAQADQITTRQLLQHTSGLAEYLDTDVLLGDAQRAWTPDELIAAAVASDSVAEPGSGHHFSNTNYIVLGEIIESLTGRPWYAEVRARISEPLALHRTGYAGEAGALQTGPQQQHPSVGGAAGGLYATAADLKTFARALLDGSLLDDRHSAAMRAFIPAENIGYVQHEYGLGLEKYVVRNVILYGHIGRGVAHSSFIGFDPETRLAVAVTTNDGNPLPPALIAAEAIGLLTDRDVAPPSMPSLALETTFFPYRVLEDARGEVMGEVRVSGLRVSLSHTVVFNHGKTQLENSVSYGRLHFDY